HVFFLTRISLYVCFENHVLSPSVCRSLKKYTLKSRTWLCEFTHSLLYRRRMLQLGAVSVAFEPETLQNGQSGNITQNFFDDVNLKICTVRNNGSLGITAKSLAEKDTISARNERAKNKGGYIYRGCVRRAVSCNGTESRVPDKPENVRVRTTATTATLWWEAPSDKSILVRGYTISYGVATPSRRIVIEGVNTNSFTLNRLGTPAFSLWPPIAVRAQAAGPGVVTVSWEDPNPEQDIENEIDGTQRHYLIQYGIYQSEQLSKMRSNSRNVKLTGLLPGKEYEIAVKVVGDDGRESPWSIRDIVLTPPDPSEEVSRYDWECDFEKDLCGMRNGDGVHWIRSGGIPPAESGKYSLARFERV
ncbi:hypothetical protein GCK32_014372, partial [Trichostrongylus colubriformis]